jgi:peptide/nickel transport system substrate-binding protein
MIEQNHDQRGKSGAAWRLEMVRVFRRLVYVGLSTVWLLSACARTTSSEVLLPTMESNPVAETGTIIVALAEGPSSFDPADHRNRPTETVLRNMFDGLVTRDARSGVHLELAESMEWLDDQTLTVELRQGVLFHDGVEMTADDVVFTFQRIIEEDAIEYPEPHTSSRKSLVAPLVSIEKSGEYSVMMHFNSPWPPAMQMLVHQQIVPKHYLEAVGTQGFIEHPIGTGPFKFVSADQGYKEVILERFDDYYGGAPDLTPVGKACVERVVFKVIPDALTRVAALRIAQVDIIQAVPQDLVDELEEHPDIQVLSAPGTRPIWMELNINHPLFSDVRVRQALNYAIDKQRLIEEVYDGRAVALPGPLSPFNNLVNPVLMPYPYHPEAAISLLEEAGWGEMIQADDEDPLFGPSPFLEPDVIGRITIDTLEEWRVIAEAVAYQLREIGLDVSVRVWERSLIIPLLLDGDRTAYISGWGDSAFDPVGHFEAKWHGYLEGLPYGRGNYSGYNNARVNELILMGETTANSVRRYMIYHEAQKIIYDEAPAVFLVLPEHVEAALKRIQNWQPASDGRINLHDVCIAPE